MTKINWNITEQELKQELVSSDNRWHISKTQKGEEESKFFLTNYDLLLTPHGSGPDYKVCFETFIENCDQYIEKIKKIQREAREHMTVLLCGNREMTPMKSGNITPTAPAIWAYPKIWIGTMKSHFNR